MACEDAALAPVASVAGGLLQAPRRVCSACLALSPWSVQSAAGDAATRRSEGHGAHGSSPEGAMQAQSSRKASINADAEKGDPRALRNASSEG